MCRACAWLKSSICVRHDVHINMSTKSKGRTSIFIDLSTNFREYVNGKSTECGCLAIVNESPITFFCVVHITLALWSQKTILTFVWCFICICTFCKLLQNLLFRYIWRYKFVFYPIDICRHFFHEIHFRELPIITCTSLILVYLLFTFYMFYIRLYTIFDPIRYLHSLKHSAT